MNNIQSNIQSYLGTDNLRLQSFNVQVNQSKEEITVDDSFEDTVRFFKILDFLKLRLKVFNNTSNSGTHFLLDRQWQYINQQRVDTHHGKVGMNLTCFIVF